MAEKMRPTFPVAELPPQPAEQRLLGLYEQRQKGLLLQRIRIPGGRLTTTQWAAIADAVDAVKARPAVHLTTRQCLEVHGLTQTAVPVLQAALHRAGLSTVGAAGDTVRNFTVDPEAGLIEGIPDLLPLAQAINTAIEALPGIWELPRKFKVSLSGSPQARMRPWTSDLGFVANADDEFTAIVAGSLGARPASGIHFADGLTPSDAVALSVAAVRLHALESDRENRRRARLRHVRERLGDAIFVERLKELFAQEVSVPRPVVAVASGAGAQASPHVRLAVPHGDVPIDVLRGLIAAASGPGAQMRIGIEHDLHLFGVPPESLDHSVRPWADAGRVVACPGAALCPKAAVSTYEAADALAEIAAENPDLLFAISGCPNSCSHAAVADVGLIGRTRRAGDRCVAEYVISLGGQSGRGPGLAQEAARATAEELPAVIRGLLGTPLPPRE